MYARQITVFLENRQGRLENFTSLLREHQIDLIALSLAETTDFGMVRAIVTTPEKAAEMLRDNGFTVKITDVVAVAVPDSPGGLSGALELFRDNGISVEYLYSLVRCVDNNAIIIFKLDQEEKAIQLLAEKGIKTLSQQEIEGS